MKKVKAKISRYFGIATALCNLDVLAAVEDGHFNNDPTQYSKEELDELMTKFMKMRVEFHLNELDNDDILRDREEYFASSPVLTSQLNKVFASNSILSSLMANPIDSFKKEYLCTEIINEDAKFDDYVLGCTFDFGAAFSEMFEEYGFSEEFLTLCGKARQLRLDRMSKSDYYSKPIIEIFNIKDGQKYAQNIFMVVHMLLVELDSKFDNKFLLKMLQDGILQFHIMSPRV